jgi:hypothetical protein
MSKIIYHKAGDNLKYKAAMLGMSMDQVIEQLNNIYRGEVTFCKRVTSDFNESTGNWEDVEGIQVASIDSPDAVKLVIPDVDNLYFKELLGYDCMNKLASVELPRGLKTIDISRLDWLDLIDRLFVYESTELKNINRTSTWRNKEIDLIVKPLDSSKKGKLYHLSL